VVINPQIDLSTVLAAVALMWTMIRQSRTSTSKITTAIGKMDRRLVRVETVLGIGVPGHENGPAED